MKVLMLGRIGLLKVGGGDRVQIENTAMELKELGVEVDIKSGLDFDPFLYDIVHVFQLDWTPETYFYVKKTKEAGKPVVLSPIHHNLKEVKKYDDEYAFGFRRISRAMFKDQHHRDTLKNLYRMFADPQKVAVTLGSVVLGLENMHKKVLSLSDRVLVQTEKEAKDLKETYKASFEWVKIPNGVSEHFKNLGALKNPLDFQDYVVCIGRIEPRKNQLNVTKALEILRERTKKDIQLLFIGQKNSRGHKEYLRIFDGMLRENSWVHHIHKVPYEDMPAYYKYAKVCISASWFETTGLTSLEALFCGTNAVASGDRAREYLGKYASYCKPDDVGSMIDALEKEYFAPRPQINKDMFEEYTWKTAAKKTLEVYKSLL
ncbi:MAG: glycosyltransferase [Patescibacteria group bacterium]|jgi:glycosyltransferase involved in cell wall biosynthesis